MKLNADSKESKRVKERGGAAVPAAYEHDYSEYGVTLPNDLRTLGGR